MRRASAFATSLFFSVVSVALAASANGCSTDASEAAAEKKPDPPRDAFGCVIRNPVVTAPGDVRIDVSDGFDRLENVLVVLTEQGGSGAPPRRERSNAEGSVFFKARGGAAVPARFDVVAYAPERDARTVFAFVGIGQRYQGLALDLPRKKNVWSADVRMNVTGMPGAVDSASYVDFLTADGDLFIAPDTVTPIDETSSHVTWAGRYSASAEMTRVFVARGADGSITGSPGYASSRVFLRGDDPALASMPFVGFAKGYTGGPVRLAYTLPAAGGFTPAVADVYLRLGNHGNAPLVEHRTALHVEGDSVVVPNGPDASLLIVATATSGEAASTDLFLPIAVPPREGDPPVATFQFPAPPVLGPVTGDDLADGTSVSFAVPDAETDSRACMDGVGVYEVTFTPTDETSPRIVVVTDRKTASLPDVTSFGLAIAPGAVYRVRVVRWAFFKFVDELGYLFDRTRTRYAVSAPRTLKTP